MRSFNARQPPFWMILASTTPGILLILLASACAPGKGPALYRFIDRLSWEHILESPLAVYAGDPEKFQQENPSLYAFASEFPLRDSGTGENPYLLKKKIKIGPVELNALLAVPRSHFRFPLKIRPGALLEFTYGIRRDQELAQSQKGQRTVAFSVIWESKGEKTEIFRNTLTLKPDKDLAFNYRKIDLSAFSGQKGDIRFITRGSRKALAFWFNPVLYLQKSDTKNVLLISLDTLRPDHLGCYGYYRNTSPNIDALSRDSAVFLNTFASSPWTLPSHVSMMTSLNCVNHRVYHTDQRVDPAIPTLADILRNQGHITGAATGGGFVSGLYGFSKGFDAYHVRGHVVARDAANTAARFAVEWIERHKDRDFFLFLHTYQIHNPYDSPAPYNTLFLDKTASFTRIDMSPLRFNHENRFKPIPEATRQNIISLYDGEIRYTDEMLIRPVIQKLKALGLYDNTMIIVTSDHGEEFFEHGSWLHTHSLYNETIKVPLVIKFFDSAHAGRRIHRYARLIDIMPTVLDALGLKVRGRGMDGKSLLPILEGKTRGTPERVFLSELAANVMGKHIPEKKAVNLNHRKLILNAPFREEDLAYFWTPPPPTERTEVFDLEKDPQELMNRAAQDPKITEALLERLNEENRQRRDFASSKTKMSEELRKELRALGYIK